MNKYLTGTVSGVSFDLAFSCILAGVWGHLSRDGGAYVVWAALGGLLAFTVTTVIHGRRIRHADADGAPGALASIALGWVWTVFIGFMTFFVLINVLFYVSLHFGHFS